MNNIDLARIFNTLSNPTRLEIYRMILIEACECDFDEEVENQSNAEFEPSNNCVGAIAEKLKLNQPTVSNHIKELLHANLVISRKVGKHSYLFGVKKTAKALAEFSRLAEQEVKRSPNSGE